ncbi:hypothetical protein ACQPZX_21995 [Actinoplanes sp. CA-142083]|uniref:hypothetical protein n=1 Tax=Actinoplanes sp. CA-142083 TaxID=3239903 RepID=UPI003D8AED89
MRAIRLSVVALVLAAGGCRPATAPAAAVPSLTFATVTKADLADSRLLPGTLDYGAGVKVRGSGTGIVTQLPAVGAKVRRGKALFRVDDQPVAVLFGDTPLFRPLDKPGLTGRDVAELRENLALLGYASMRVRDRDVLDAKLLDAAKRWQHDLDIPSPSFVTPQRAVVLDGPGRVSAVTARPGDPAGGDLLTVTGATKVVSVPVAATDASSIRVGAAVSTLLPSGGQTPGVVRSVGTQVSPAEAGEPPKVSVTIRLTKPADVAKLDAAAVQVRFTTAARKGVLSVPVGALVALREGGYALQKRDGSLVPARIGMFAGGLVEVSGPQVAEGLEVVTTP